MAMAMLAAGCGGGRADDESAVAKAAQAAAHCEAVSDEPVRISGGKFPMGQESVYAEEGPVRETTVDEFLIDPHEVTVAQFSAFVAATKHVTRAEMPVDPSEFGVPRDQIPPDLLLPGSAVFVAPDRSSTRYEDWWKYIPGANWKSPTVLTVRTHSRATRWFTSPMKICWLMLNGVEAACQPKRSGNTRHMQASQHGMSNLPPKQQTAGKASFRLSTKRLIIFTELRRWDASRQIRGAYMIWLVMSGK